jgi:hypothetical protein
VRCVSVALHALCSCSVVGVRYECIAVAALVERAATNSIQPQKSRRDGPFLLDIRLLQ